MSNLSNKWLYIPVEIKVRELPAKILLAAAAARVGYNVVIGRKSELSKYMNAFPKGIFLGFGAQKNFAGEYERLKKRGFTVAIMDEEGLVTFSDDMYRRLRLSDDTLNHVDLMLAWGKNQSRILEQTNPANKPVVYETGNVRFDILRPEFRHLLEPDAQAIKERFGRTILINSSFGSCNHFDGKAHYFEALKKKKILQNEDDTKFYESYFLLKELVFKAYLEVIPQIAKAFPEHTIIVRPHPSEDYSAWVSAAEGVENVKIIHEGNVHPWLLACDAVVHHFCTTALEAFVADTPALAYRPFKEEAIETGIVYKGSIPCETPEGLIKSLRSILGGDLAQIQEIREEQRAMLQNYIENIEGGFAFEKTLAAFDKHVQPTSSHIAIGRVMIRKLRTQLGNIYRFLKRGGRSYENNYMDHKFASLDEAEIRATLRSIGKTHPEFEEINIKKIDHICFLITGR